jgi:DNA-binding NarL/FixJ family response regulator
MWTVSLVDDDDELHDLLRRMLRSSPRLHLVRGYATGEEALRRLLLEKPAVVLMDIKLPGMDGIECVRRLHLIDPPLPTHFIMLTGHEDDNLIFEAFKAGARGYLWKAQLTSAKLLMAVNEAMSGGAPMSHAVARKVVASFGAQPRPAVSLTNREQEVLRYLAAGLMYKEIADELFISVNTVRTHLESIYHKLNIHCRKDALSYLAHPQQWMRPGDQPRK